VGTGDLLLLALAGVGAGVIGSTAGLASLVSYPALLLVGLPPVTANVTNTLGLIGSSIGSVAASRPELEGLRQVVLRRLPLAAVGGAVGALLLLVGPPSTFESVVPFLVAGASVLLLLSPRVRRLGDRRSRDASRPDGGAGMTSLLFLTCAYGGYFGAAAGVMILALLLSRTDRSLPVSNAMKNAFLGVANATAAVVFALRAPVEWVAVPPLLLGCLVGGWLGPAVVRRVPEAAMRWAVGLLGLFLAVRLGVSAWL
jgi:uncharacterized membrane protein YfcA